MRIIDVRVTPPVPGTRSAEHPEHMKGYQQIYGFKKNKPDYYNELERIWEAGMDAYLEEIGGFGIEKVVCYASDAETTYGARVPNDLIAKVARDHPKHVIAGAGVDPHKGKLAIDELKRCVEELGMRAVQFQPYLHRAYINDPIYTPLLEKCQEWKLQVWVHTAMNWTFHARIDHGRAIYLEDVLMKFPELVLIAGHAGWPWTTELCALAWKWPNLYIDISAMRPKYFGVAGAGYESLVTLGNSVIQDKIMFGTAFPVLPQKQSIDDILALPLSERVREKWFYTNAARLLGIE